MHPSSITSNMHRSATLAKNSVNHYLYRHLNVPEHLLRWQRVCIPFCNSSSNRSLTGSSCRTRSFSVLLTMPVQIHRQSLQRRCDRQQQSLLRWKVDSICSLQRHLRITLPRQYFGSHVTHPPVFQQQPNTKIVDNQKRCITCLPRHIYQWHHNHKRRSFATSTTTTTTNAPQTQFQQQQQHQQLQHEQQMNVMSKCQQLYNSMIDFNNGISGPLVVPYMNQTIQLPMVLCVGNHSSGKSSFINYVLGRPIQTAGVAPTDDSFTIIAPLDSSSTTDGKPNAVNDYDQDGFAIIGHPDYGFTSLQQFGPTLQHHTVFKLRSNINANFIMVDSPGMIDAPANYASSGLVINQNSSSTASSMDRGYDFTGVVKWYADRADVVLLFFDPDKPGTTGETLSVMVNALSNIDHKLFIIFNKADRFMKQQIHDFARAYGSLCWNLSKVIPRKDLPRIYTMCLPFDTTAIGKTNGDSNKNESSGSTSTTNSVIPPALQDLYDAREEVVAQVRKAPERRLDNVITNLYDSLSLLHMYARIVQDVQKRYYQYYWSCKYQEGFLVATGVASTVGCAMYGVPALGLPAHSVAIVGMTSVLGTLGTFWYNSYCLRLWEYQNCTPNELYNTFTRLYSYDIMNGNEHVAHVWTQIRDALSMTLQPSSVGAKYGQGQTRSGNSSSFIGNASCTIRNLSVVKEVDIKKLEAIIQDEIPLLRRHVSPTTSPSSNRK